MRRKELNMRRFSLRVLLPLVLIAALVYAWVLIGRTQAPRQLLFHAGVGQRSSLNEIRDLFQARCPEVRVDFAYKGAGYFIADISRSREGDLYMPGEEFYLLQAVERGFITDYDPHRDIAAYFVTCIIAPRGNPENVRTIRDFARPGLRVGLGNPQACAIGIWHEKTFRRAGIWDQVRQNATFSAKCIPELGNAVQHRLVDATIVWSSTAALYLRDVEIIPLEPRYRGVVRLPIALLAFSKDRQAAQRLKDLILSSEGKAIFASHGYAVDQIPVDAEGFITDQGASTDQLMHWLVRAAAMVKDDAAEPDEAEAGPLIKEVVRQKKTLRAGT